MRFVAAVEDVVKLGNWIAAFDADWHAMGGFAWLRKPQMQTSLIDVVSRRGKPTKTHQRRRCSEREYMDGRVNRTQCSKR